MRALGTAATGMKAMSTNVDIIANNLANVNTTGFKKAQGLFQDLFYQQIRSPGAVSNLSGKANPSGVQAGLGVRLATTMDLFTEGELDNTGRDLDLAIKGNGFFMVKIYNDVGEGVGYTRDGHFVVDAQGNMVQGGPDGFLMDPPITIPLDYTAINITGDGVVNVTVPTSATPVQAGQIQLANFTDPEGLMKIGGNIYIKTGSSGDPIINNPTVGGLGQLQQGFLEKSNVDPVRELTGLIEAQRGFELNSKVITAADQMLQVTNSMKS